MRHMVVIVPELTGYASIRYVAVRLPYAAASSTGKSTCCRGREAARRRDRETPAAGATRAMRTLVRWALKCDSAEQLGERLKRRTIANCGAEGWHRPAMPAPRPSSIASSANLDRCRSQDHATAPCA